MSLRGMRGLVRTAVTATALTVLLAGTAAFAADYSSTNFVVKDPVIAPGSGYATSSGFQL